MSAMHEPDLAIVGAGPAGLAAALAARRLGATVLLIAENAAPGGPYYRQPAVAHRAAGGVGVGTGALPAQARRGRVLTDEVERSGVEIWRSATVWGPAFQACSTRPAFIPAS